LITESVGLTSKSSDTFDGYELTRQRLPKVHAVQVRLETRVGLRDQGLVVRNCEDITVVEATELLSGRLDIPLANDARCLAVNDSSLDFVATGYDTNVAGVDDLGQIEVVLARPIFGDVAVDGNKVANSHVSESITTKDVDTGSRQISCKSSSCSMARLTSLRCGHGCRVPESGSRSHWVPWL
jgi:hypothetical protein